MPAIGGIRSKCTGQLAKKQPGIGDGADVRSTVSIEVDTAAIRRYEARFSSHMAPIIEPKVRGHTGEHDKVSLPYGFAALMAPVQGVRRSHQSTGHAGQVDRHPDALDRFCSTDRMLRLHECLATDDEQWPLGIRDFMNGT